jgi:hypothetical protein
MDEYFHAWTSGGMEHLLSYFFDDCVINLRGPGIELKGKEAVNEGLVTPFYTAFPGNIHHVENLPPIGKLGCGGMAVRGRLAGRFSGHPGYRKERVLVRMFHLHR